MSIVVKRPKRIKIRRPRFVDPLELKRTKHAYVGRKSSLRRIDVVDATFKAEVEILLQQNKELLRRLAL